MKFDIQMKEDPDINSKTANSSEQELYVKGDDISVFTKEERSILPAVF